MVSVPVSDMDQNLMTSVFEAMISSYNDEAELLDFATTWQSPAVNFRLFQLRHTEYENDCINQVILQNLRHHPTSQQSLIETSTTMEEDLQLSFDYVEEQEEIIVDQWDPQSATIQRGMGTCLNKVHLNNTILDPVHPIRPTHHFNHHISPTPRSCCSQRTRSKIYHKKEI